MRVGIIGAGLMGGVHAAAWNQTPAQLTGIFSLDAVQVNKLAAEQNATAYDTIEALIDAVDVVDICTPTFTHHPIALQAAAAGKHIVCEKPLARTYQQGQEMIAACAEAGVHLLVAHVVRFFPEFASAKAVVDSGDIGRVAVVRLTRAGALPGWAAENWLHDPEKSGGMILDLMIHDFDYARWIAGEVKSVYAKSLQGQQPGAPTDYSIAILTHHDGAISNIEGGWTYPQGMFRTALEIAGDKGLIEHPAGSTAPISTHIKETGEAGAVAIPASPLAEDPYTTEIKHFYDVISGTVETPRVTPQDALAALQIALAAQESATTGRPVQIEEA